jgi:cytochrome c551/c552
MKIFLTAILQALGAQLVKWIGPALAWVAGRRAGKKRAEEKELRRRIEASDEARRVADEVAGKSNPVRRDDLDKWVRDHDGKL